MFKPEVAFYLGEQKSDGYSGIVSQDNLFFCLEINSGISTEQGHEILDLVKGKIKQIKIENLSSLDAFIVDIIKKKNLPSGFSLSAGYLKNNILYLKTVGMGKIFIRRKGKLGLLIEKDNTASGLIEDGDFFIFSTSNFVDLIGDIRGLEETFDHRSPTAIIDEITPSLKAKKDFGAVALFVNFHSVESVDVILGRSEATTPVHDLVGTGRARMTIEGFSSLWFTMKTSKKTLTFITVFFLFCVFLWSVILGYQRRTSANASEKIKLARELITQKLSTAQDVSFLNMERATILINESSDEVKKLRTDVGEKNKEVIELESMVKEAENKILKKEQKQYREFYDLSVDDKSASGNKIYIDEEIAYILDKKKGVIYQLSLEKKSLSKNQFSEIKSADLIAGFENESFFHVKDKGVYRINSEGKLKKIVEDDKEWSDVKDINAYNGNIYLLDRGKDEIWKYIKGEDRYSSSSSYFQLGQSIDLSYINSLAIDGSVYLAGDSLIVKYTSGLRDGFSVDLPDKNASLNKIITSKELEKVYLWDKNNGTIYILDKTGEYVEQINSEILSKGNDVFVYKGNVFVLMGSKIYRVD